MRKIIILVILFFLGNSCKSDWVEIPQVADNNKPQWDNLVTTETTNPENFIMASPREEVATTSKPKVQFINNTRSSSQQKSRKITRPKVAKIEKIRKPLEDDSNVTLNGFLPFLNTIQNPLISSAKKSLKSKISVLIKLRDHLLNSIAERMSSLWQFFPAQKSQSRAEPRGHHDDDSEMDFPSNEGALMTIGFLTFAVFLIKLVLKLIHALKNKQNMSMNMMTTMMPTMTGAAATYFGRKKRENSVYEQFRILQLIDEYKFT